MDVYNTLGQKVKTLVNKSQMAGYHKAIFNAEDLTSGVYFYQLNAGDYKEVRKTILLK